jgi:DNA topoisomerase-1
MRCLVIVESPSKCKIITGYLNGIPELVSIYGQFSVVASCGHIRDLKKKELSIDIGNNFTPVYEVLSDSFKKKLVADLKTKIHDYVSNKDMILLATDSDAEGEAISWHIREHYKIKPGQYKRIIFNEITKNALKHAVLHAGEINISAVDAQETRRILDRIVGYQLSPLLWKQFNQSRLSAGRVQSAALKIILDRNTEIESHVYQPYWKCIGTFESLTNNNIEKLTATHQTTWEDENDALYDVSKNDTVQLAKTVWNAQFKSTNRKKSPPPPLITSTLQQECYKRYNIPAKAAMKYAQDLYEGGHITYMRTDSVNLSDDAQKSIIAYISMSYGNTKVFPRKYETKNASAQEAHEAIRPTHIEKNTLDGSSGDLTANHKKIYELIWRYAVASQMIPAIYNDITYTITPEVFNKLYNETDLYIGKTSILICEGFMIVSMPETKANPDALKVWNTCLDPANKHGLQVKITEFALHSDVSRPAPQFNEASFVKVLEKEGIGRPSTYASVVDKLYDKSYIVKGTKSELNTELKNYNWKSIELSKIHTVVNKISVITQDKDSMIVTPIGKNIVAYIAGVTPYLIDTTFTKLMESDLDKISTMKTNKLKVLGDFYEIFGKSVSQAQSVQSLRKSDEIPDKPQSKLNTILKDFPEINSGIVNTRYGNALYNRATKKFYSISPLMEWRKISIEQLSLNDAKFILSLPLKINTSECDCVVDIGRYGLYLKIDGKNVQLHHDLWENAYNSTLTYKEILANPVAQKIYTKTEGSTTNKTPYKKYKKKN